jgi:predicted ATPase
MPVSAESTRIVYLGLRNWRNFQYAELPLEPRTFLVGPNAAGKSNLLDAVRFLRDIVAVGGGFEEAVSRRGGVSSVRCLSARRKPDVEITIRLGTDVEEPEWEYTLGFGQNPQRKPQIRRERVLHRGQIELERPNGDDEADPERLSQTFLEQVNVNRDFRPVADFLRTVRYRHIVPQLIREPDRSVGKVDDAFGGDFLEQMAKTSNRSRDAMLERVRKALQVAVPQLQALELYQDTKGTHHLRGKYEHWRPQGAWQTESDFSDGTLRLLGLLWAVLDGKGPLLLEEPELSLHPEVIRYIAPMLSRMQRRTGRQVIASTQSAELLHDPGIGLNEVFLLIPSPEGTEVTSAASHDEIRALLNGGLSMGEAVMPSTRPAHAEQLSLFSGGR